VTLAHVHWFSYTEDPVAVPAKYRDAVLAECALAELHQNKLRAQRFSAED
jgi:hypothetical protein